MPFEENMTPVPSSWVVRDTMFQEKRMYERMCSLAQEKGLTEFSKALPYAREMHGKQNRKPNRFWPDHQIPYIVHPLMMACHACSLGLEDDQILATVMLHDVCEDCGIRPEELPFSDPVRHSVALLTRPSAAAQVSQMHTAVHSHQLYPAMPVHTSCENEPADPTKQYYAGIMTEPCACIVKALDRCNNVSTMALSFSQEKMIEYINETEEYIYPLLDHIRDDYPQYEKPAFAIKYQLLSLTETIKSMMMSGTGS